MVFLKKLKFYGFDDSAIEWFLSYLCQRGHKTYCNNKISETNYVNIGVPQGSVLGPTLFLIYINDINHHLGYATCNIYADDVLLYYGASNVTQLNLELQHSLDNIKEWYVKNKLVINASKSNTMLITTRQKEALLKRNSENYVAMSLNDAMLCQVNTCKYLGVHIDANLNWCNHVDSLCKELNFTVWTLSRLRPIVPFESLVQVYMSIMQPKIDYAITVWGYSTQNNLNKVQNMQNRAIRAIMNNYDFINVRGVDLVSQLKLLNV